MNSFVLTDIASTATGAPLLDVALDRLSVWLDTERETLGRVLAQSGRQYATGALEALDQLHLEPDADYVDVRSLLEEARTYLDALLEILCTTPSRCRLETAWGLPGPSSFDTHLRWSAARLSDILATLDQALAA